VGAGFAGSVLAERLGVSLSKKILIVDTRSHWRKCLRSLWRGVSSTSTVPTFSHQLPRGLRVPHASLNGGPEHRVLCKCRRSIVPIPLNLTPSTGSTDWISPHSKLESLAEPREYPHIRGCVGKVKGTLREVLPWLHEAMGHWPVWTRQVSPLRSHPHKPWWAIFHRHVSGNAAVRIYPDVREDVVAPEHQNYA